MTNINFAHVETFSANLKKAIFDRETVTVSGGDFNREELIAVRDALACTMVGTHTPGLDVTSFVANLKSAFRNRETVEIGGGLFSGEELEAVLGVLNRYREIEAAKA